MKKLIKWLHRTFFLVLLFAVAACGSNKPRERDEPRIQLIKNEKEQNVEVRIDGQLFTSYRYSSALKKPVLYPLVTPKGTSITRKFPLEPSEGERVDHPHHVGLWFNYGDVNGFDFWNNSDAIAISERANYGTIVHQEIKSLTNGDEQATLEVMMHWLAPDGTVLLQEDTKFIFEGGATENSIQRITKLTAIDKPVDFKDNKEGLLGIRVTHQMELPSDKPSTFTDAKGQATKVKVLNNEGVNGNYLNDSGVTGLACWGLRSKWMVLSSKIGEEEISLAILDHKNNVGYPTYWHARGYGLFAANPLGQSIFSKGKESLNFKLNAHESTTFKHKIILSSSLLDQEDLAKRSNEFLAL